MWYAIAFCIGFIAGVVYIVLVSYRPLQGVIKRLFVMFVDNRELCA